MDHEKTLLAPQLALQQLLVLVLVRGLEPAPAPEPGLALRLHDAALLLLPLVPSLPHRREDQRRCERTHLSECHFGWDLEEAAPLDDADALLLDEVASAMSADRMRGVGRASEDTSPAAVGRVGGVEEGVGLEAWCARYDAM